MVRVRIAIALLSVLVSLSPVWAVEPDEMLADPTLEARARAITREIRCVVCQNQSVDDSDAPLAHDIRVLVRERLQQGESDDAVRDFLVARYGNFVLLRPPLQTDTLVLWFGPLAFLAVGFVLVWSYFRAMRRQAASNAPLSATEAEALKRLAEEEAGA